MKFKVGEKVRVYCPIEPLFHNKIGIISGPRDDEDVEDYTESDGTLYYSVMLRIGDHNEELEMTFEQSELRKYDNDSWQSEKL